MGQWSSRLRKNKMGRKAFRIWEGCYRYHNSRSRKRFQIKLASRLRANAISKVRTMASVLVNSYQEPKSCDRLIVDEALMESFWSHRNGHMACGCKEAFLIGDVNQLSFIDSLNLFDIEYTRLNPMWNRYRADHGKIKVTQQCATRWCGGDYVPHHRLCIFLTDDGEDATGRFVNGALAVSDKKVYDNNAIMAIRNRDKNEMDVLERRRGKLLD
ncbi:hypothetical protein EVAR_103396_1 [Eumeta japonica]|uniref:Uncharacterized protein n=1 Tax=Eumeta variegata TaxID=151549 RepID=A0A4C1YWV6_EUMVA|nr:hypothetical protein EVAR_103396_1 [Eumeta japonica]